MTKADNISDKSRIITARLSGENLSLFEELGLTPTELVLYGLNKCSEENEVNTKKISLTTRIKTIQREIQIKQKQLETLQKELNEMIT